jgi:hypothetical protein
MCEGFQTNSNQLNLFIDFVRGELVEPQMKSACPLGFP